MDNRFSPTRRRVLMGLVAVAPATLFLGSGITLAAEQARVDDDSFLQISRTITGTDTLSDGVSQRIQGLLADRIDQFGPKLKDLADTMQKTGGSREEMLAALTDDQVDFALAIARPWYLGYVGTPSGSVLNDDAVFATFLEAQSYEKIIDKVPRPTYPDRSAGWWAAAPDGVDAPAMPDLIVNWTFQADGPAEIQPPDPEWRAYATAHHASIDDARRAKPISEDSSTSLINK